jgi:hypothetical protein
MSRNNKKQEHNSWQAGSRCVRGMKTLILIMTRGARRRCRLVCALGLIQFKRCRD